MEPEALETVPLLDRVFRVLESGIIQTLLSIVGGLAGTFLDGRYFVILTPLVPAAIHRSKALEGIQTEWSTFWLLMSFPAVGALLLWCGFSLNKARPSTITPAQYAAAVRDVIPPTSSVSTSETIFAPQPPRVVPPPASAASCTPEDSRPYKCKSNAELGGWIVIEADVVRKITAPAMDEQRSLFMRIAKPSDDDNIGLLQSMDRSSKAHFGMNIKDHLEVMRNMREEALSRLGPTPLIDEHGTDEKQLWLTASVAQPPYAFYVDAYAKVFRQMGQALSVYKPSSTQP